MEYDLLERIKERSIIQGGMGAGVSNYNLARTVATHPSKKALGVVSGVALEQIQLRRLQQGNEEVAEALLQFPDYDFAKSIVDKYFIPGGKDPNTPYKGLVYPVLHLEDKTNIRLQNRLEKLITASTFAEVSLAKQGHDNPIGINFLYEIEWPMLPAMYGAMLAEVDAYLIGAGLPSTIPPVLDSLAKGEQATMHAVVEDIEGKQLDGYQYIFDPQSVLKNPPSFQRPPLLAIINGHLAARGVSKAEGYVIEGPTAGGHNPPARSKQLDENGEPLYGPKDDLDLEKFQAFLTKNAQQRGLEQEQPYWFAGEYFHRLPEALRMGACGVQVGTPFAFSRESGIPLEEKAQLIKQIIHEDGLKVFTDPHASPSGFPFKVIQVEGSMSDLSVYEQRQRICDIGHLITPYITSQGKLGMRCPAEPIENYVKKGGKEEKTKGKQCLCNNLVSTIGLGTVRTKDGWINEPPIYTSGSNHDPIRTMVAQYNNDYSAQDVIDYMLSLK